MTTLFKSFLMLLMPTVALAITPDDAQVIANYRFEVRGDYEEMKRVSAFMQAGMMDHIQENAIANQCDTWPDTWAPARTTQSGRAIPHRVMGTILCAEGEPHFNDRTIIIRPEVISALLGLSKSYETYDAYKNRESEEIQRGLLHQMGKLLGLEHNFMGTVE